MEYIAFLDNYVDEEHLSAMKSLVTLCREYEPITLSFPLPTEEEDVDIHYFSMFEGKLCIGVLAACIFSFTGSDGYEDISRELTAFVHPDYRRQGIFTTLIDKFLETEHLHKHLDHIAFLSDRRCPAALYAATTMNMKQTNSEYMMKLDISNREDNVTPLLRITKCRNRRLLASHYARIFNMSNAIGRSYVDMTLDEDENITPFLIRMKNPSMEKEIPIGSGYLMQANPEKAYLFSFGILPQYQGKGLGLISLMALKHFLPESCKKITVQVSGNNIAACRLYEKAGFVLTQQLLFYEWV